MKKVLQVAITLFLSLSFAQAQNPELFFTDPVKMPKTVNSTAEEDFPLMSHDGTKIFFNRTFHPHNKGGAWAGQDIWFSSKDPDGGWLPAKNSFPMAVEDYINDEYNNVVVGISGNGDTLYLLNHYHHHRKHHFHHHSQTEAGISYTVFQDTAWSPPIDMSFPKLDFVGQHYGLYMHTTGDVLFVSENGPNSLGMEDLYVCIKDPVTGTWESQIHLGDVINSSGFEISPFLANDKKTLYFASNREGGFGNSDIYYTKRLDDTWTNWSEPVNMGSKINTYGFDAYFTLSDDNHILFVRNLDTLTADIFIADIVEPTIEELDSLVMEDMHVQLSSLVDPESFVNLEQLVNLDTIVKVKDILDVNQRVDPNANLDSLLYVSALDFKDSVNRAKGFNVMNLANEEVRHLESEEFDTLNILPRSVNIKFDFNIFTLDEEDRDLLSKVVHIVNNDKDLYMTLIGHTCSIGSEGYNKDLSKERAISAKKYLLSKGIPEKRIEIRWMGEVKPIADNETEDGRRKNRRVEIDFERKN